MQSYKVINIVEIHTTYHIKSTLVYRPKTYRKSIQEVRVWTLHFADWYYRINVLQVNSECLDQTAHNCIMIQAFAVHILSQVIAHFLKRKHMRRRAAKHTFAIRWETDKVEHTSCFVGAFLFLYFHAESARVQLLYVRTTTSLIRLSKRKWQSAHFYTLRSWRQQRGVTSKIVPVDTCARRRFRSACAFAQSDQNLRRAHFG